MHLFGIMMKDKKLTFVSNHYFREVATFGIYLQALNFVVTFGGLLLKGVYCRTLISRLPGYQLVNGLFFFKT